MPIRPSRLVLLAMLGLSAGMAAAGPARAADLRIGTQNVATLDPHFLLLDSNIAYNQHIYGALTDTDEHGKLVPDLATAWTSDGVNTWRFTLRQGVTFHDGTPFTADDVVFSLNRVPNVPNNPSPYSGQLLGVTEVRKIDDHTVDIVTDGFLPLLPAQIAKLSILSARAMAGRSTEDLNAGRAAIGTGPYRVVQVQGKERILLSRFDNYWGKKPDWEKVEFRILPTESARSAALLSGDVDLIEFVPLQDAARLAKTPGIAVHSGGSARVMYLGVNVDPKLEVPGGRNPMQDPKVRQAVSMAINRDGLVRSTLEGYGRVATQIGVPGMLGYLDDVRPDAFSPDAARKLLAEAGYPDGFSTSLVCPNGRYVADAQTCQAVGQMLARVGIKTGVETLPASVFFSRIRTGANPAPLFLTAWSNVMGDGGYTLNNLFHSFNRDTKMGSTNRSGYSDAETDRLIDAALHEPDAERRLGLLQAGNRRGLEARVLLPLFTAPVVLASRADIRYDVGDSGSSEMTSAMRAHPR
ncbi:ABC transporter substrate-binding protein [Roseomonas elaeocarpi]|uniref:ABC transporter substrate-binding protein n=1 Tax=Roseomonas elaeocarpi TaxID=907779 RepID=A0ABV6JXI3_9PROT